jgi:hypothetical protein
MRHSKGYRKYAWVGNQISADDMARLYRMKQKTKRPITTLVAEAVSRYVKEAGS